MNSAQCSSHNVRKPRTRFVSGPAISPDRHQGGCVPARSVRPCHPLVSAHRLAGCSGRKITGRSHPALLCVASLFFFFGCPLDILCQLTRGAPGGKVTRCISKYQWITIRRIFAPPYLPIPGRPASAALAAVSIELYDRRAVESKRH